MINKREKGSEWEERAVIYLQQQGVQIAARNFRCKLGEIDIIGKQDNIYLFIEVKYRKDAKSGFPAEAVNKRKQKTICKVADYYRLIHQLKESSGFRFDIISIMADEMEWIQNAFEYCNG